MSFEEMQKAWQSHDAGANVTINADVLLKEIRRNQQQFWATIFRRDAREAVVAFLLALYFGYRGLRQHDWTGWLAALACFGVGAFLVADRLRQRSKQPTTNDSIKGCVETSLNQVNHQIWLLKNVLWWYLLPLAGAVGISTCGAVWRPGHFDSRAALGCAIYAVIVLLVYWGVYWLNQFAVRKFLEPRRQELETLLINLK